MDLFEKLHAANPGQARVQQLMAAQYVRHASVLEGLTTRAAPTEAGALRREACSAIRRSLGLWRGLEAQGGAVDDENRAQRAAMEKAVAGCGAVTKDDSPPGKP